MLHPIAPITDRRIRIALVGCGRISRNHIKAIALHHDRAELVAICDTQPERLDKAQQLVTEAGAEHPGAATNSAQFGTYSELLAAVQTNITPVDLVVLATPSGLHPSQAIAAAEVGLHVCTEKPMATRWADGVEMVKACDDAGVRLFVVKQNRFNSTLQLVKRQLRAGRFGKLAMVAVNVFWQRPQSYYNQDSWRGTWEFDGGALMNQASHYVDLLDWLVGPVESVSASIATLGRVIEVEDTAALQLRWRNGALGTMAVTMLTYPKNLEGSITLLGETGTVRIGGPAVNQIEHWAFADESSDDALVEQASYATTSVYGYGHPPYYANVLDALQGKEDALCDGREGLRSLELLIGAYRSARDGRAVHLPMEY
ncbi:Gfo/Idh/MocA family oxidoreductase [Synechococcus sp. HJ21-Hayes]|uniref:Gfo/Idh/MocA family protein n=1 Tax=unclassified Synechococcus TaxID=2626047 RepID=UPI0020CEE9E0|nr:MULTISPECIES: Gfo/Idh/MocA family oxidoreductase [unclassified Synechococcus]MCP9830068.1 Gfo/Idh/MocA family oxidoreductase [Synechococcus sp. JJ3a-Johnson]MCP9852124.1 Gfo/Idh/MocA family oxidoreductase [Synechococcus sp. HJ21-Hayes]